MNIGKWIIAAVLGLVVALGVPHAVAGTTGAIEGKILDTSTGLLMEGVRITITSSASQAVKFELVSDKKGHFYRSGLYAGAYQISFEKDGYTPQASTVRIKIDDTARLDVKLQPVGGASAAARPSGSRMKKAVELIAAGAYDEAVPEIEAVIAEDAANPIPYFYRAVARERTGKTDEALADYKKAIELKPDFVLPIVRMGMIMAKRGEFQAAGEAFKKAVDLNDQDPATYFNYGVCLVNSGQREEAKAAFEKLLVLDPLYADGVYQLGLVELGLGNQAAAKSLLEKFVAMDPKNGNAAIATEILKSLK